MTNAVTTSCKRVFILGAGFSKALAGLPLATELTGKLIEAAKLSESEETAEWLAGFQKRLHWLEGGGSADISVEKFFHYAQVEIEYWRMQQQLDSENSCEEKAKDIERILDHLNAALVGLIWREEKSANLDQILKFAKQIRTGDAVITFNYDTLVERVLTELDMPWHHGLNDTSGAIAVLKMHGSIDWIICLRDYNRPAEVRKLFPSDKPRAEDHAMPSDDCELWRLEPREACEHFIETRKVADVHYEFALAGLGSDKRLSRLPGSGRIWAKAEGGLQDAEEVYVIGFSLSQFDPMVRLLFGRAMMKRRIENTHRRFGFVRLIDPAANQLRDEYERVFGAGSIAVHEQRAEEVNWSELLR